MKPGRELDALIAERVMGVTPLPSIYEEGIDQTEYERRRKLEYNGPEYSTDIAAAWPLAQKFNMSLVAIDDHKWWAKCSDLPFNVDARWLEINYKDCDGIGETAPLAICLAALKATNNS